jgi:hypothetical protein
MSDYDTVVNVVSAGNFTVQQVPLTDAEIAQAAANTAAWQAQQTIPPLPSLEQQVAALWAQVVNNDPTQTATLSAQISSVNTAMAAATGTTVTTSTTTTTPSTSTATTNS